MTQIPILSGIFTDEAADFRVALPVNRTPVLKGNGISEGYLRPSDGIVYLGTGPGIDRGGISWDSVCYRVMGNKLVKIDPDGTSHELGSMSGVVTSELVKMDYGVDRLAIAYAGSLWYWDGGSLLKVTDPDLGTVIDVKWVDGYFMTTDGTSLVVAELNDPTDVNPLKYGSSEADPDPVKSLHKIRNEIVAVNRYTCEFFDNVGGDLFPFQRVEGAQIQKGTIGTHSSAVYMDALAFLGSGRNEAPGIYIGANSTATKISTREVDTILLGFTESELSTAQLEVRNDKANQMLYVHLPDRTLVYDAAASATVGGHVWTVLTSAIVDFSEYRARNFVWCYNKWIVGDPQSLFFGYMADTLSSHWDQPVRWEFGTGIVFNGGMGALFHQIELVGLTGRAVFGVSANIGTSYSVDGVTWSQEKVISVGAKGNRAKRLVWFGQGSMRNWRIQRFRGDSDSFATFSRLEVQLEPLGV